MFDINNPMDVTSVASSLLGMKCSLYEVEKDVFLMKTVYGEVHAVKKSDIKKIMDKDRSNRLPKPDHDKVLVLTTDKDYLTIPIKFLKMLQQRGDELVIYSPSKILAPVPAHYISDTTDAWQFGSSKVINNTGINGVTIGTPMGDMPVLAVDLDRKLIENRDEDYIESLRGKSVYVHDEFSQFLLDMEGIKAEVL